MYSARLLEQYYPKHVRGNGDAYKRERERDARDHQSPRPNYRATSREPERKTKPATKPTEWPGHENLSPRNKFCLTFYLTHIRLEITLQPSSK